MQYCQFKLQAVHVTFIRIQYLQRSVQTNLHRTSGVHHLSCSTRSDGQDTHGLCSEASGRKAAWECPSHLKMRLDRVTRCNNYHGLNTKSTEVTKPSSSPTEICCRSIQSKAASSCLIIRYRIIHGRTEKK